MTLYDTAVKAVAPELCAMYEVMGKHAMETSRRKLPSDQNFRLGGRPLLYITQT
jgi:hypothetical protein